MVRRLLSALALASALLALGACSEPPPPPDPAASAPTSPGDTAAWKTYVQAVGKKIVPADQSKRVFTIFLEHSISDDLRARTLENVKSFVGRGIADGTLMMFASPNSEQMAVFIEEAFAAPPKPDMLKGISVIFIGKASERERVATALAPWGATLIFHEAN